jgi:CubicO group peptidase (beta-lactamase class C family)
MGDVSPSGRRAVLLLLLASIIAAAIAVRQASVAGEPSRQSAVRAGVPTDPATSRAAANPPSMAEAGRAAAMLPRLHSLLVSWGGELILEHYASGRRPSRLANIKSASKSIISALVGIAIQRGHIKSVDEPIVRYFPELRRDRDPRKQTITIEDLLTMRSGLESTSGRNYGAWVRSRNWVRYALDRPLVSDPGTSMEYSTGSSHLLSAIVTKAAKTSTWQFAQNALMRPLGFTLARWPRDPQGIFMGGNEMLMTPRQMATFGELYMNAGRHNGKQIVPASWVETSCEPRTASRWNSDRQYGYGWWMRELGGRQTCFAWGYGGQYIFVFRDLGLVVVATSSVSADEERRGYRRALFDLIERDVIGPVTAAASSGSG